MVHARFVRTCSLQSHTLALVEHARFSRTYSLQSHMLVSVVHAGFSGRRSLQWQQAGSSGKRLASVAQAQVRLVCLSSRRSDTYTRTPVHSRDPLHSTGSGTNSWTVPQQTAGSEGEEQEEQARLANFGCGRPLQGCMMYPHHPRTFSLRMLSVCDDADNDIKPVWPTGLWTPSSGMRDVFT